MYNSLENKVVLITGASSGIGAEVAKKIAQQKAKVIVNYHSSKAKAEALVAEITAGGGQAIAIQADVSDRKAVDELVQQSVDTYGTIDVLINNAGSMVQRIPFEELTDDTWNYVYDVNVKSVFYVTQSALPYLKLSKDAAIVNVASVAGRNGGGPGSIHYASAKGAVLTLTKGLAKELIPFGIRVNGVNPGLIGTPFHDKFSSPQIRESLVKGIPLGREGTPAEVANIIAFLASSESSYVYGEVIEINGAQLLD